MIFLIGLKDWDIKEQWNSLTVQLNGVIQIEKNATYFERRTEEQSEITLKELKEQSSEYIYNKIRMLQDPYPNAYLKTNDGKKNTF